MTRSFKLLMVAAVATAIVGSWVAYQRAGDRERREAVQGFLAAMGSADTGSINCGLPLPPQYRDETTIPKGPARKRWASQGTVEAEFAALRASFESSRFGVPLPEIAWTFLKQRAVKQALESERSIERRHLSEALLEELRRSRNESLDPEARSSATSRVAPLRSVLDSLDRVRTFDELGFWREEAGSLR